MLVMMIMAGLIDCDDDNGKRKAISVAQVVVLKTFVISVAGKLIQTLKSFGKIYLEKIVFIVYCLFL